MRSSRRRGTPCCAQRRHRGGSVIWPSLRRLHVAFKEVLIAAPSKEGFEQTRDFAELQRCHGGLLARHSRVQRVYKEYDGKIKEYTRRGEE